MEKNYIKVEGYPDLVRDPSTGAIINNDKNAYQNYLDSRDRKLRELERIENLEKDMSEIKSLMHKILDKL
ncbi:hypothetical protein [Synechococcus phage DSL-LC02]|nr:hypothetical protein [Synechococcus phage DSL-LC02]